MPLMLADTTSEIHKIATWVGWEALVAIGTIGLATFTARLALSTRRLARETDADVRGRFGRS